MDASTDFATRTLMVYSDDCFKSNGRLEPLRRRRRARPRYTGNGDSIFVWGLEPSFGLPAGGQVFQNERTGQELPKKGG